MATTVISFNLRDFKGQVKLADAHSDVVRAIQKELNRIGYSLVEDGIPGLHTLAAFAQFKKEHFLSEVNTIGETTVKILLETEVSKFLVASDYVRAAKQLGVEVAMIKAVTDVEAAGRGFFSDGRPKILFERHIFYKYSKVPVSQYRPDLSNPNSGGYVGGVGEYNRLNAAMQYDRIAALESASWGLGQVMGFNYETCGYSDVESFVSAMKVSEGKQLLAMMTYIKNVSQLFKAMKCKNWATFAQLYNGPLYKRNNYDVKLANAYGRYA